MLNRSWTIYYDTCYAFCDCADDLKAGIKSSAIALGDAARYVLPVFAGAFVASLGATGYFMEFGWHYYLLSVAVPAILMVRQLMVVDYLDQKSLGNVFVSNAWHLGTLVWAGMMVEYFTRQM